LWCSAIVAYDSHITTIFSNKDKNMMTLEQIRQALSDRMPIRVAEATGLHYNTIRQVRDNPDANPTHKVLQALSDYLESRKVTHG
jgi:pyruvate dehydrogenase complex dehydrogenase (E1) component